MGSLHSLTWEPKVELLDISNCLRGKQISPLTCPSVIFSEVVYLLYLVGHLNSSRHAQMMKVLDIIQI